MWFLAACGLALAPLAPLAPERSAAQLSACAERLAPAFGARGSDAWHARRLAAIDAASSGDARGADRAHLVYGEMQLEALARLLDAAGVRSSGETFVDVGAGDGLVVLAAALLFAEELEASVGLEIVPGLVARARAHRARVLARAPRAAPTAFVEGDVYAAAGDAAEGAEVRRALEASTLGLCFATTWSLPGARRELPRLSDALGRAMRKGARVITVDARLCEEHGWRWEGELRVENADVAPHSTAQLYTLRA